MFEVEKGKRYLMVYPDAKGFITARIIILYEILDFNKAKDPYWKAREVSMRYAPISDDGRIIDGTPRWWTINLSDCKFKDDYITLGRKYAITDSKAVALKVIKNIIVREYYYKFEKILPFKQNMPCYGYMVRKQYDLALDKLKKIRYNDIRRT